MSWGGGIKRDSLDADFSRAIRERAGWRCEKCERFFPVGERAGLHCSHVIGRRNKAVRYHPWNAFALCFGCHKHFTENPVEHIDWVTRQIGENRLAEIRARSWSDFKLTPDVRAFIASKLKAAIAEQARLRGMGFDDVPLPFASPYPSPNDILEPASRTKKKAKKAKAKRSLTHPTLKKTIRRGVVQREKAA